jgi:hypothetical protein
MTTAALSCLGVRVARHHDYYRGPYGTVLHVTNRRRVPTSVPRPHGRPILRYSASAISRSPAQYGCRASQKSVDGLWSHTRMLCDPGGAAAQCLSAGAAPHADAPARQQARRSTAPCRRARRPQCAPSGGFSWLG